MDSTEKFPTEVSTRKEINALPCCFIDGRVTAQNIKMTGLEYGSSSEKDTPASFPSAIPWKSIRVSI